jgi:hypothetical protein
MFRALTILAATVALAVSAAPASAGTKPPPRAPGAAGFSIDIGTSEALKGVTDGTSNTLARTTRRNGIIAVLIG